ncbi:hypothetical protein HHX47_DHR1000706 [Lentinula edodes]|nr:hypothetical protein HHX47_DHR1000706 [Lentinula edodes]
MVLVESIIMVLVESIIMVLLDSIIMVLLESIIDIDVSEQSPLEQPEEIIELEDEQSPLLQLESEDEDEQSPLLHPLDAADDDEPEQSPFVQALVELELYGRADAKPDKRATAIKDLGRTML